MRWSNLSFTRADCQSLQAEYEFHQYRAPPSHEGNAPERNTSSTAKFLEENPVQAFPPLTHGMFGYSLTRPVHNIDYYYGIYDTCEQFKCNVESWHTETGPGVFEAVRDDLGDPRTANKTSFRPSNIIRSKKWPIELVSLSE